VLGRVNRAAVLELVQEHGPLSRAEIAEQLRISAPTVGRLVRGLIEEGLLRERERGASRGGRRPILLEHNPRAATIVGVDIGGSGARMALSDLDGTLLHVATVPLPRPTPEDSLAAVVDGIGALVEESRAAGLPAWGVGVGVPGVPDQGTGTVRFIPSLNWADLPLRQTIEERLGLPVWIENDVNLAALGEQWRGAGRGLRDLVYLFIGTGIGAGVVIDGRLHRGARGTAGEVGYFLLERPALERTYPGFGFFEGLAAGPGIARRAGRSARDRSGAEHVFALARDGDPCAREVVSETVDWLALAIGNIACLLDPQAIILGGGVAGSADLLVEPIRDRLAGRIPSVPLIRVSDLGDRAAVLGAVALAAQRRNGHLVMAEP
jgi:predicted NBD/HSP70 family sugar kinase